MSLRTQHYDHVACVDFETFWAKDFTLASKTMSMTEYIRSPRFEAQTCAVKLDTWPTAIGVAGFDEIKRLLNEIDWTNTAFLAHHTHFDGLIATHHFGIAPVFWLDTMSISRAVYGIDVSHSHAALSARLGRAAKQRAGALGDTCGKYLADMTPETIEALLEYNIDDANEEMENFLTIKDYLPQDELRIIDATIRMYCEPTLELDKELLLALHGREVTRRNGLIESAETTSEVLGSPRKFADLLRSLGVVPPMKISPRTGKLAYAFAKTDLAFKALLDHEDEAVRRAVEARLGNKGSIVETRSARFAQRADLPTPVYLSYAAARTLRWGGGDLCLTGDTKITVQRGRDILEIVLSSLQDTDLVWDGVEFVEHGGLVDKGDQEVIEYQGLIGTPGHEVLCEETGCFEPLGYAAQAGYSLAAENSACAMESATQAVSAREGPLRQ